MLLASLVRRVMSGSAVLLIGGLTRLTPRPSVSDYGRSDGSVPFSGGELEATWVSVAAVDA